MKPCACDISSDRYVNRAFQQVFSDGVQFLVRGSCHENAIVSRSQMKASFGKSSLLFDELLNWDGTGLHPRMVKLGSFPMFTILDR